MPKKKYKNIRLHLVDRWMDYLEVEWALRWQGFVDTQGVPRFGCLLWGSRHGPSALPQVHQTRHCTVLSSPVSYCRVGEGPPSS